MPPPEGIGSKHLLPLSLVSHPPLKDSPAQSSVFGRASDFVGSRSEAKHLYLGPGQGMVSKPPGFASAWVPRPHQCSHSVSPQPGLTRHTRPAGHRGHRHLRNEGRGTKSHSLTQTAPVGVRNSSPRARMQCPTPDVTHVGTALGTVLPQARSQERLRCCLFSERELNLS